MDWRETKAAQIYYQTLDQYIAPYAEKISPDQASLIGLGLAVLVPLGFSLAAFLGVLLMALSAVSDGLDGYLARQRGEQTRFGAFLDSTLDRFADFFYLMGFWVYVGTLGLDTFWIHLGLLLALLASFLVSYSKARLEALGGRCDIGLMDRTARTIYLLVWGLVLALIPPARIAILWIGLLPYLILVFVTVWQRISLARRVLDQEGETV
ncbi:MAG: CDP-alcohol phosphatidyltransferase family protein [Desulfohalobiaceae bacterium]